MTTLRLLSPPHVESLFWKANDPANPRLALWMRLTVLRGRAGDSVSMWAMRWDGQGGKDAVKQTWPLSLLEADTDALGGRTPAGHFHQGGAEGALQGTAGQIRFSLRWSGEEPAMAALPARWMYERAWPRSKVRTPFPRVLAFGVVDWAGERWALDGWVGMVGHNWGKGHNPMYRWAQASALPAVAGSGAMGPAIVEAFAGRTPVGPWLSPWLSGVLVRAPGLDLSLHHTLPRPGRLRRDGLLDWEIEAEEGGHRVTFSATAPPEDTIGLGYEDPDGIVRHCLNSTIAAAQLTVERKEGGRWAALGRWAGAHHAATESLTDRSDHGVLVLA